MLSNLPKSILIGIICMAAVSSFAFLASALTEPAPFSGSTFVMPSAKLPIRAPAAILTASPSKRFRNLRLRPSEAILLTGEVGPQIDPIIERLNSMNFESNVKEIFLLIDSPGGSVSEGTKLVTAIESSRKPVVTVCLDLCASMAAIIHQYGHTRLMVNRSTLMFHDASGGVHGSIPQMRTRLNYWDRLTTKMDAQIAARAGMNLQVFLDALHSEIWIDAEDATNSKFNDEIVYVSVSGGLAPPVVIPALGETQKEVEHKLNPAGKPMVL